MRLVAAFLASLYDGRAWDAYGLRLVEVAVSDDMLLCLDTARGRADMHEHVPDGHTRVRAMIDRWGLTPEHSSSADHPHRPFACRKHHTIDVDELFCRHYLPAGYGQTLLQIPSRAALLAYGAAMEAAMRIGDIRDFFPGPAQLERGPMDRLPRVGHLAVENGLEHVL